MTHIYYVLIADHVTLFAIFISPFKNFLMVPRMLLRRCQICKKRIPYFFSSIFGKFALLVSELIIKG